VLRSMGVLRTSVWVPLSLCFLHCLVWGELVFGGAVRECNTEGKLTRQVDIEGDEKRVGHIDFRSPLLLLYYTGLTERIFIALR